MVSKSEGDADKKEPSGNTVTLYPLSASRPATLAPGGQDTPGTRVIKMLKETRDK